VGLSFQGPYLSTNNYAVGDGVLYNGAGYVSLVAGNHGNTPDQSPADWLLFAEGGATGAQGLPGLVYQGVYASASNYALGDVVFFSGASYVSLAGSNHGNTPNASPLAWGVLSAQGSTGAAGGPGPQGVAGPAGAVGPAGLTGPQGLPGLQGIAGEAGAQGLTGPAGTQGLSGPAGPQGVAGPVGLAFRGPYASTTNYALGDGVLWQGAGYVSLLASNMGNTPDQSPAAWSLFATGADGATGATGAAGPAGPAGMTGSAGPAGAAGPQGPQGVAGPAAINYTGNYNAATSYGVADAVSYGGSTYVSLVAANHGNTPDQSAAAWAVLVAQGPAGVAGVQGATGPAGVAGPAGAAGVAGPQGPPVSFRNGWLTGQVYAIGDAVSYSGSSYIAITANAGREPDLSPTYWAVLAASGAAGPAGPTGLTGLQGPTGVAGPAGASGAAGPAGVQGPIGPAGSTGATGVAGPTGPVGAAGPAGLVYQGSYDSTQNYARNDAVTFQGASYLSLAGSNTGNTPGMSPAAWALLAAQGGAGPAGAAGPAGSAGATGIQGPAGAAGATGLAGPAGAAGPVGATGAAGPAGAAGVNGLNGVSYQGVYSSTTNYQMNDGVTFGGSSYLSLAAGNVGNTPSAGSPFWAVLAAQGASGPAGATGTNGVNGAPGAAGPQGAQGATGPAGAAGQNGPAGIQFQGVYRSIGNYALNDAVTYNGSTYLSLTSGNSGQVPDQSPAAWALLASAGATGAPGPAGAVGNTGAVGAAGAVGPQGPTGSSGAPGINFRGAWMSGTGYAANDAVTFGGATYLAQMANASVEPDTSPAAWAVLAAAGSAGPTGPSGAAAAVSIGSVTTGAPGTSASVVNAGTTSSAVLNFTIPQGAAGGAGTGSGSGTSSNVAPIAMFHSVSYAAVYYSIANTNQSATETTAVLTWVPSSCTATSLTVYSLQTATITVTLRLGHPGAMAATALSCVVSTGQSCTGTGSVFVSGGSFLDLGIANPDSNPTGVWAAVTCN
jgi:hypothetical protein